MVNNDFLYLVVWMDLYSRRIVGWQLEEHMKEELIVTVFKKSLLIRSVKPEMIVHSDRGEQYDGNKFRKLIYDNRLQQSIGRADNPYDNAFMESCFNRFKTELLQGGTFQNREDAQTDIFEFIEMYFFLQKEGTPHSTIEAPWTTKTTTIFTKPKQLYFPPFSVHLRKHNPDRST